MDQSTTQNRVISPSPSDSIRLQHKFGQYLVIGEGINTHPYGQYKNKTGYRGMLKVFDHLGFALKMGKGRK